jgi:hypothetical protein
MPELHVEFKTIGHFFVTGYLLLEEKLFVEELEEVVWDYK